MKDRWRTKLIAVFDFLLFNYSRNDYEPLKITLKIGSFSRTCNFDHWSLMYRKLNLYKLKKCARPMIEEFKKLAKDSTSIQMLRQYISCRISANVQVLI